MEALFYANGMHYLDSKKLSSETEEAAKLEAEQIASEGIPISPNSFVKMIKIVRNGTQHVCWIHR